MESGIATYREATYLEALRRRALWLVWIVELWNLLEAGVALWSGISAKSVALVVFGADSFIELFAGGVLIWHLSREREGREHEAAERKAHLLVGMTFFLLAVYILFQGSATLVGWLPEPRESLVGIALLVVSAVVMTLLFFPRVSIAKKIGSSALRAEAVENRRKREAGPIPWASVSKGWTPWTAPQWWT